MTSLVELMAERIPEVAEAVFSTGWRVVAILFVAFLVSWLLIKMLGRLERTYTTSHFTPDDPEHGKRIGTLFGLTKTVIKAVIWVVAALMVLSLLGLNIGPILAGAGILGLAVGFGAQNLVRDFLSGLFHIMENQIRVGDVAAINGVSGVVERITYRIIVLRDAEQTVHVFNHGSVTRLANMTKDRSAMVLDVGVAYRENPDQVMAVIRSVGETLSSDPDWQPKLLEPLEVLGLNEFADSAVVFRVRLKTRPGEQWSVKRELARRLKLSFDREGIEFPFPHRTHFMGADGPPLEVRLLDDRQQEGATS